MDRSEAEGFADAWRRHQARNGTVNALAEELGMHPATLRRRRLKAQQILGIELPGMIGNPAWATMDRMKQRFTVKTDLPDRVRPFEEILADRSRSTSRRLRAESARELIDVELDISGPFAIAMIGDPHIDNPGCNLDLLMQHTDLIVATDGMFAICVGDVQDNWIGRLARLWASQGIDAAESQVLVDGWLRRLQPKLIALAQGNHDLWQEGMNGLSAMDWIRAGGSLMERHGVRMRLTSKDRETVTINMRHDFPGRSQYNAAHGPTKSLMFGCRDDVAVAGHTHVFGRSVMLNPENRKPMHGVRLGSYKHSDDYARQMGMLDNNVSEAAVLMVDPNETDPRHRTWIEDNPFRAARVLKMLRAAKPAKRKAA